MWSPELALELARPRQIVHLPLTVLQACSCSRPPEIITLHVPTYHGWVLEDGQLVRAHPATQMLDNIAS
jgi:hypothetical protein